MMDASGTAINITDYTGIMKLRRSVGSFTSSVVYVLSTEDDSMTMPTPTNGEFVLTIPAPESLNFPIEDLLYDFIVTAPDGFVSKLLSGSIRVCPSVSV
jgi:hypothetical protein